MTTTHSLTLNNGVEMPASASASSKRPPTRPVTPSRRRSRPATATSTPPHPAPGAAHQLRPDTEAYRALETLLDQGKVRAIGVSNFMTGHLATLLDTATVVPAVNQIEVHPYFQQRDVQTFRAEHGILTQAWSPIGGITFYREGEHTSTLEDPTIVGIAKAHSKSAAQVMLRWHLQQGRSAIPKSTKAHRIAENFDVFDFELSPNELAAIDALDTDTRGGPEPVDVDLATYGMPIPEA